MQRPPSRRGWNDADARADAPVTDVFGEIVLSPRQPLRVPRTVAAAQTSPPATSKTLTRPGTPTPCVTGRTSSPSPMHGSPRPRGPRPTSPRPHTLHELVSREFVSRAAGLSLNEGPAKPRPSPLDALLPALDLFTKNDTRGLALWGAACTPPSSPSRPSSPTLHTEALEVIVTWLSEAIAPPFALGPRTACEARGVLAQLMLLSSHTAEVVREALYRDLVVRTSGLRALLRTLVPPVPEGRGKARRRRDTGENDGASDAEALARADAARGAVSRVFVGSLAPIAEAAYLLPPNTTNPRPPLTAAATVAIGARAWRSIGESTLAATTLARLASPAGVCIHLGGGDATSTSTLAFATWILPSWPDVSSITLHAAHELRVPRARVPLVRPDVAYRLVFRGATWDAMVTTVRAFLDASSSPGTDRAGARIEVVLPFNAHGTLQPPTKTPAPPRRKPVPALPRDLRDTASVSPKSPLRQSPKRPTASPSALSPARTLPRPTPSKDKLAAKSATSPLKPTTTTHSPQHSAATARTQLPVDLPSVARRLVGQSRAAPVTFVTVEELVRHEHACVACSAPWLA